PTREESRGQQLLPALRQWSPGKIHAAILSGDHGRSIPARPRLTQFARSTEPRSSHLTSNAIALLSPRRTRPSESGQVRACFAPSAVRHGRRGETARGVSKEADDATLPERRRAFANGPGRGCHLPIPDPDADRLERGVQPAAADARAAARGGAGESIGRRARS